MTTPKNTISRIRDIALTILACSAVVALVWGKIATPEIKKQVDIAIDTTVQPWINMNEKDHTIILKKLENVETMILFSLNDEQRKKVRFLLERNK